MGLVHTTAPCIVGWPCVGTPCVYQIRPLITLWHHSSTNSTGMCSTMEEHVLTWHSSSPRLVSYRGRERTFLCPCPQWSLPSSIRLPGSLQPSELCSVHFLLFLKITYTYINMLLWYYEEVPFLLLIILLSLEFILDTCIRRDSGLISSVFFSYMFFSFILCVWCYLNVSSCDRMHSICRLLGVTNGCGLVFNSLSIYASIHLSSMLVCRVLDTQMSTEHAVIRQTHLLHKWHYMLHF